MSRQATARSNWASVLQYKPGDSYNTVKNRAAVRLSMIASYGYGSEGQKRAWAILDALNQAHFYFTGERRNSLRNSLRRNSMRSNQGINNAFSAMRRYNSSRRQTSQPKKSLFGRMFRRR